MASALLSTSRLSLGHCLSLQPVTRTYLRHANFPSAGKIHAKPSPPRCQSCEQGAALPRRELLRLAVGASMALSFLQAVPSRAEDEFTLFYGMAAGPASYGGYGGNASRQAQAEYTYEVPSGWKERTISKVEKGTNGTDSEFFKPGKKSEKVYTLFLGGFRRLGGKDNILNDIALSDVNLQDAIGTADSINTIERSKEGQLYYDYEIDGPLGHQLITVTVTNNKLYALFVTAPPADWGRDEAILRRIYQSFKTRTVAMA